jgi:hypothetical protein
MTRPADLGHTGTESRHLGLVTKAAAASCGSGAVIRFWAPCYHAVLHQGILSRQILFKMTPLPSVARNVRRSLLVAKPAIRASEPRPWGSARRRAGRKSALLLVRPGVTPASQLSPNPA